MSLEPRSMTSPIMEAFFPNFDTISEGSTECSIIFCQSLLPPRMRLSRLTNMIQQEIKLGPSKLKLVEDSYQLLKINLRSFRQKRDEQTQNAGDIQVLLSDIKNIKKNILKIGQGKIESINKIKEQTNRLIRNSNILFFDIQFKELRKDLQNFINTLKIVFQQVEQQYIQLIRKQMSNQRKQYEEVNKILEGFLENEKSSQKQLASKQKIQIQQYQIVQKYQQYKTDEFIPFFVNFSGDDYKAVQRQEIQFQQLPKIMLFYLGSIYYRISIKQGQIQHQLSNQFNLFHKTGPQIYYNGANDSRKFRVIIKEAEINQNQQTVFACEPSQMKYNSRVQTNGNVVYQSGSKLGKNYAQSFENELKVQIKWKTKSFYKEIHMTIAKPQQEQKPKISAGVTQLVLLKKVNGQITEALKIVSNHPYRAQ